MKYYIAHTNDKHTSDTSKLEHTLTQWYVAVPLFFALLIVVLAVSKDYFGFSPVQLAILSMGILLIAGVLIFSLVPILSIVCLALGIVLALFFTLISIAS